MRSHVRPPAAPARPLWLIWGLLLACSFSACEEQTRLQFNQPSQELNVLRGRVFNTHNGRELSGATVKLIPEGQSFVTSTPGTFRIDRATLGSHRLEVSCPGFNTEVHGVLLANRDTVALDVGLTPSGFTGNITGRVVDAVTGLPLAGVRVTVPQQRSTLPLPGGAPAVVAVTTTDGDGRFSLGAVPAGRVIIVFEDATHRPASASLDVPAGGTASSVFNLTFSSGALAGFVRSTFASNPLTSAQVSIISSNSAVLTDATGAYRIDPLFAGTYRVDFQAPGHDRLEITTSIFTGGTTIANVTMRFNLARLKGSVKDGAGNPQVNALVSVPALDVTSRTDANGLYDFGLTLRIPAPVQPLAVGVSAQNFAQAAAFVSIQPGQTVTQDFVLVSSSGNLVGQVVSSTNSGPVGGAVVTLPALNLSRITDFFGSFTFFNVPSGSTQITVQAAGFTTLTTFVPVFAGRTNGVTLIVSP